MPRNHRERLGARHHPYSRPPQGVASTREQNLPGHIAAGLRPTSRAERVTEASTATQDSIYAKTSLLRLPAELRLMIYDILWETALVHVHTRTASGGIPQPASAKDRHEIRTSKLTWTPCTAVDTQHHCLCAHPVWDGTVAAENRCSDLPSNPNRPTGIFALRWTCKDIRRELGNAHQHKAVVSIEERRVNMFTRTTPKTVLNAITRLGLSGTDYRNNGRDDRDTAQARFMLSILFGRQNPYAELAAICPRLETVVVQGFLYEHRVEYMLLAVRGKVIQSWGLRFIDCFKRMFTSFNRRTTVILDVSYRPSRRQELDGLADIERSIVTRPGVASGDAPEEHDWTACKLECVPHAKEALQASHALPQAQ